MASCITNQWAGAAPQVRLTVNQTASTDTTVTLSYTLEYLAYGYAAYTDGVAREYTITIDGANVKSGTFNISGIASSRTITSGSTTVSKTTSARNVSFGISFRFGVTWSGSYANILTASGSISISAKTSYSVKYNANGGSGAPGAQTKWAGTNLTLSSTKPTRTGYTFQGWATSSSGAVAYQPGGTYSANAAVTLYAVWKAVTYTVKYNANGGTGAPANQTKTYGKTLVLSSTKPTKMNYNFKGWGTSASSTTVAYNPGGSYTANAAITLYAIWELAYVIPRISNFKVERCTADGTVSEEGTYGVVEFSWATDKTVTSIKIRYKASTASEWSEVSVAASGTSGNVEQVFGSGSLNTEYTYDVQVVVADSMGSSGRGMQIAPMAFIIDFLAGGGGVAFGKPADYKGFEVAMDAKMKNLEVNGAFEANGSSIFSGSGTATFNGNFVVNGVSNVNGASFTFGKGYPKDRFGEEMTNGVTKYESDGIDPNTTLEELILTNKNTPTGGYMYIRTMFYSSKATSSARAQYALPYSSNGSMYHRYYYNGAWSSWRRHVNEDEIGKKGVGSVVLYNGSMTSTATSASWSRNNSDFNTITVTFRTNDSEFTSIVVPGVTTSMVLCPTVQHPSADGSVAYIKSALYTLANKSISFARGQQTYIYSTKAVGGVGSGTYIYVCKVVGNY